MATDSGPHGIQIDVAARLEEMFLVPDERHSVAVTKEVAGPDVSPIVRVCITAVQPAHSRGESVRRYAKYQVVVVREQAVGEAPPTEPTDCVREESEEECNVVLVGKDRCTARAARSYVIVAADDLRAELPWHAVNVARQMSRACDKYVEGQT